MEAFLAVHESNLEDTLRRRSVEDHWRRIERRHEIQDLPPVKEEPDEDTEKANKEVQKFEGNQKRLAENIKQWEQKLEAAHIELKGTKDGLVLAYVEQTEAQADKRQLL